MKGKGGAPRILYPRGPTGRCVDSAPLNSAFGFRSESGVNPIRLKWVAVHEFAAIRARS